MGAYDPARRHPIVIVVVCGLVIATAVFIIINSSSTPRPVRRAGDVFFDEATGELSHRGSREIPPIDNDAGHPTLVRAIMPNENGTLLRENIVYLFRFTPEAKARLEAAVADPKGDYTAVIEQERIGKEVRLPAPGSPWVAADTPEGKMIMTR